MKFKNLLYVYLVYVVILAYFLLLASTFTLATRGKDVTFYYPKNLLRFEINTTKPWRVNFKVVIRFEISEEVRYVDVATQLGFQGYVNNPGHLIIIVCTYYCNNVKIGESEFHLGDDLKMKFGGHFDEVKVPTEVLKKGENIVIIDISIIGKVTKKGCYSYLI